MTGSRISVRVPVDRLAFDIEYFINSADLILDLERLSTSS